VYGRVCAASEITFHSQSAFGTGSDPQFQVKGCKHGENGLNLGGAISVFDQGDRFPTQTSLAAKANLPFALP
jgi:hypothetical protein